MGALVSGLLLGCIYTLIVVTFVIWFRAKGYFHTAIIGYILLGPYLLNMFVGAEPTSFQFMSASFLALAIVVGIGTLINLFVLEPLSNLSVLSKVIASTTVFYLIVVITETIWPRGIKYEKILSQVPFEIGQISFRTIELIGAVISVFLLGVLLFLIPRTTAAIRVRAYTQDPKTASAYGISQRQSVIYISIVTCLFAFISGMLLSESVNRDTSLSPIFFAVMIAIAAVAIARQKSYKIAIIASFVIAILQMIATEYSSSINDTVHNISSSIGLDLSNYMNLSFAQGLLPFALALISLVAIPSKWVQGGTSD